MPRDSSGTYTLPISNPVVTGTPIQSAGWANPTMSDIGNEITNSLDRGGRGGMTGPFGIVDGSLSAPGLRFTADSDNGLRRTTVNTWTMVAGGTDVAQVIPTNFQIFASTFNAVAGIFSGNVSGVNGTFSGPVSGTTGTFTGNVSGVNGTFSGPVSGTTGTFTGNVEAASYTQGGGPVGGSTGKNVIIGGDFSTNPWQRGTIFPAVAAGSTYTADRWVYEILGVGSVGVVDISLSTIVPTVAQAGQFTTSSMGITPITIDATVNVGSIYALNQYVEGHNFVSLAQKTMTLSFWHRHNLTGIYCVSLTNSVADRSVVFEYTQAVSNAWEKSVIVIPASPAAGGWNYNIGRGIGVRFAAQIGTTFQTVTVGSWITGNFYATANQVNALAVTSNTMFFALIQLETGSTASTFDNKAIQDVLDPCLRYYERQINSISTDTSYGSGFVISATSALCGITFEVKRIANATIANSTPSTDFLVVGATGNIVVTNTVWAGQSYKSAYVTATVASGLTTGQACGFAGANSTFISITAEL